MLNTTLALIAFALYLGASAWPAAQLLRRAERAPRWPLFTLGFAALALHGAVLLLAASDARGLYLGFFGAGSVVGWLMAALVLFAAWRRPVVNLAVFVLPIAGLAAVASAVAGTPHPGTEPLPHGIGIHIYTSIAAYSVLAIAALQALLLAYQDYQLRHKHPLVAIRFLPPLQVMESLLFELLGLGFVLLSAALLSGFVFLEDMFAQHLVHKTVLSIAAWVLFGILLLGHWRLGWRGRTAVRWTVGGYVALMLAYFGSRLVKDLILHIT